jgi:hypothetical protein
LGSYEAPDNNLFIGEFKIGTLACDTIKLYNYGKQRKIFDNEGLFYNLLFSVPASQYPIIIEPGEYKDVLVCFHPNRASTERYHDTLYLKFNCLVKQITLEGMALEIIDESKTKCNLPVRLVLNSVHSGFSLGEIYPNPVNNTTKLEFSIPNDSQVNLTIFDSFGNKNLTLIDDKLESGDYEIEFSVEDLPQGLFFINLTSSGGLLTRAFVVEK